jgi:hypothetical protein
MVILDIDMGDEANDMGDDRINTVISHIDMGYLVTLPALRAPAQQDLAGRHTVGCRRLQHNPLVDRAQSVRPGIILIVCIQCSCTPSAPASCSSWFHPHYLLSTPQSRHILVAHTTQIGWGAQTGMARGAVRSPFLSFRHTKITCLNNENLIVASL